MRQRAGIVVVAAIGINMAWPASAETMTAEMRNAADDIVGAVSAEMTASGRMLVSISLSGMKSGTLGVHIHEIGDCSAADFKSAGGHLAGDAEHGVRSKGGPHPGDLPNLHVASDGMAAVQHFLSDLDISDLSDADGSAVIVHSGADDYESQPAGAAGDRIACGVFRQD